MLLLVVGLSAAFAVVNGIHDAGNAIAAPIVTGAHAAGTCGRSCRRLPCDRCPCRRYRRGRHDCRNHHRAARPNAGGAGCRSARRSGVEPGYPVVGPSLQLRALSGGGLGRAPRWPRAVLVPSAGADSMVYAQKECSARCCGWFFRRRSHFRSPCLAFALPVDLSVGRAAGSNSRSGEEKCLPRLGWPVLMARTMRKRPWD